MITTGNIDLTQDITAADARLALRISAKLENENKFGILLGDINRDGNVTAADAKIILRTSAQLK